MTATKICGLKSAEALDAAIAGGADFIGLVFCESSPRHLQIEQARNLAARARGKVRIVALLVNPGDDRIREIVTDVAPDLLQLHGSENVERLRQIRELSRRPLIKAVGVASRGDVESGLRFLKPGETADILLFDAKPPKEASRTGGHGVTFDWSIVSDVPSSASWMLSGGLDPENVAEAIRRTHAPAVDVSSGVEIAPGVKDPELIRRFLRAAKTAKQA